MPVTRGFVASLIFVIGWLALVVHSRPHVAGVAANKSAIDDAITTIDTWTFTPALLEAGEWGWYENADQMAVFKANPDAWLRETSQRFTGLDRKIGERLTVSGVLTLIGVLIFWGGIAVLSRAKKTVEKMGPRAWVRGIVAGGILLVVGPLLPCIVVEGPSGSLMSGPPLATGVVIMLITLVSKRLQPQT